MRRLLGPLCGLLVLSPGIGAQIKSFPYTESFDGVTAPALPSGWTATGNFVTTSSSPRSAPNALFSNNSTLAQFAATPRIDFSNRIPDKLQFWTSRSSTHTSGVLIEASIDNGGTFPIAISDTLRNPGNTSYNFISLNLPSSLSNQSQVKIRWRVIGGVGGTGGTYRVDDISLTVKTVIDLAVRSVSLSPPFPLVTDTVTLSVVIANLGIQTPSSYTVDFFDDVNKDSIGQSNERFRQLSPPPINPGDSITVQTRWSGFASGEHQVLVVVTATNDENSGNNRGILNFLASLTANSLVINEIMYGPIGGEPEWIEIFNNTSNNVNLRNWKISNRLSGTKYTFTTQDVSLPPRGFGVITRDTSTFRAFHPSAPGLLFINTSMPTALFRNDSDAVVLFDTRNLPIDSLFYRSSWGGTNGRSLERIAPLGPSNDQSNWGTSLHAAGSTPGRTNSLTQKDNDLAVRSISTSLPFPSINSTFSLFAVVKNIGKNPATNYTVGFFEDVNGDSVAQESELISRLTSTSTLQPSDSASFSTQLSNLSFGDHRVLVDVSYSFDEETSNNGKLFIVSVGFPQRTVVINEIMYAPSGGEPEWVEVYNNSTSGINLRNWRISNRITSTKYVMSTTDIQLPARGFAVVTRDSLAFQAFHTSIQGLLLVNSSFPIALFSNSGDGVVLFDARNAPMDSMFYSPSWGGSGGRSLERIAPLGPSTEQTNWGTSLEPTGSTPGRINTHSQKDNDLAVRAILISPALPKAGDSITLTAPIANVGTNPAANYTVGFFEDVNGDSIGQPTELITSTTSTSTLQPGDSTSFIAQVGNVPAGERRYLVTVTYGADEFLLNNRKILLVNVGLPIGSVVINEIMYGPSGGEPEWVELYNATNTEVNLKNWKISNRTTTTRYTLSTTDVSIGSSSYIVITRDPSILNFHASIPSTLLLVPSMPTALFSNSGDAVVIVDAAGATMDSLTYTPAWGGSGGRSLERTDYEAASTDSTNWGTSTDPEGSSPGRQNTNATLEDDLRAVRVFSQTANPQPGATVRLSATIQNVGRKGASGYTVRFFQDADRDSVLAPTELLGTVTPGGTLQRRDSVVVELAWNNPPSGSNRIFASLVYSADQRLSNNTTFTDISIGFQARALIINEIMYAPVSNQAEWIELYNPTNSPVDLRNWTLSDMKDAGGRSNVFSITRSRLVVPLGGFAVVSSDSSIFTLFPHLRTPTPNVIVVTLNRSSLSLNNDGDDVIITDLLGTAIDSVRYAPSWHNQDLPDVSGISLERINPSLSSTDRRNWSSSVEKIGGTPGKQNSIFTKALASQVALSLSPNPFSPDGDGFEDFAVVSYHLTTHVAQIRIKIYDSIGRLARTLANNEPSGPSGQIIWDGFDDDKRRMRMGIYVVFLEAIDSAGGTVESAKAAVVVAGRL